MSASIPPNGPPKATVTSEFGDVRISIRWDLNPGEAYLLADEIRAAADKAQAYRLNWLKTIEEAGK
jgi:hypothetical protein